MLHRRRSAACAVTLTLGMPTMMNASAALEPVTPADIIHCYSAVDAVTYANTYASSYNPNYTDYSNSGGDCANFASQCVYAGGLLTTTASQTTNAWAPGRSMWTSSSRLRNFMGTVYGTIIDNPSSSDVRKGDLVFYRWSGYSIEGEYTYHHTAVCIGSQGGVPQIAHHSHTNPTDTWNLSSTAKRSIVRITRYGDVDSDEAVTTTDARMTLQHFTGSITLPQSVWTLADVDYDGEITSTDARLINQAAVGNL